MNFVMSDCSLLITRIVLLLICTWNSFELRKGKREREENRKTREEANQDSSLKMHFIPYEWQLMSFDSIADEKKEVEKKILQKK